MGKKKTLVTVAVILATWPIVGASWDLLQEVGRSMTNLLNQNRPPGQPPVPPITIENPLEHLRKEALGVFQRNVEGVIDKKLPMDLKQADVQIQTLKGIANGIDHLVKEFCNLMTGGGYKRGDASCSADAGVGHDSNGFYTFNPATPEITYRGNEGHPEGTSTSTAEIENLANALNNTPPKYYQYNFKDAFGVSRFLPPMFKLGTPWPKASGPIATPTRSGKIRDPDKKGGGHFLAIRAQKTTGAIGFHAGEDYVAMPNERIYSTVSGEIVRLKNPGKEGLTGLEIKTPNGYVASVYYVAPTRAIQGALGDRTAGRPLSNPSVLIVTAGSSIIGYAQDLNLKNRYPGITNHVHVTLQDPSGLYIDPSEPTLTIKPGPAGELRVKPSKPQ